MSHKELEKEIVPFVERHQKIVIKDMRGMKTATSILSQLNQYNDKVTEEREKLTRPLNESLKAARALFKPLETRLSDSIASIRSAMSLYQTESIRKARDEEARIAARVAPGKGNLSMDTAMKKIDSIEKPVEKVNTEDGTVKFRTVQRLKIIDASRIPRQYLVVDEKAVLEALKAGTKVDGAEVVEEQVVVNLR